MAACEKFGGGMEEFGGKEKCGREISNLMVAVASDLEKNTGPQRKLTGFASILAKSVCAVSDIFSRRRKPQDNESQHLD